MKLLIADWINFVLHSTKFTNATELEKSLQLISDIEFAKSKIWEDYRKIYDENLEVKKDEQWTPISKDWEEIKFVSEEWRQLISQLELEISLDKWQINFVKKCINNVISWLRAENSADLFPTKVRLVKLYNSL